MTRRTDARQAQKFWTVAWIGLVAGTLDITENIIFNHFRGVRMKMIFQYIASGLIGMKSFSLGAESVVLGVAIHYSIAMTWTVVFYLLSRRLRILTRQAAFGGIVYGGVVYVIMNFVVLPLTAVPRAPRAMTVASRVSGVLALLFCIGLAISLLMRRYVPARDGAASQ